jgi:hypothetical protein
MTSKMDKRTSQKLDEACFAIRRAIEREDFVLVVSRTRTGDMGSKSNGAYVWMTQPTSEVEYASMLATVAHAMHRLAEWNRGGDTAPKVLPGMIE